MQISAQSTEYLRVSVIASVNGTLIDPGADSVAFAVVSGVPGVTDWLAGSWESGHSAATGGVARILVGPTGGAKTLTAGQYDVWIKITDSPEVPIRKVAALQVTN